MRIRKNAKLSFLFGHSSPSSPAASSQSHVCQLNQSPWDVISFSHDSSFPPTTMSSTTTFHPDDDDHHLYNNHQPDRSDSLTLNASFGNSPGPVYRNWKEEGAPDDNTHEDDNDNDNHGNDDYYYKKDNAGGEVALGVGLIRRRGSCCRKTNGKGWQCSREAKQGHYLCEYHYLKKSHQAADISIRKNNINMFSEGRFDSTSELPALAITAAASSSSIKKSRPSGRRGRPPKKAPLSKSSMTEAMNSNQFYYYYSGFGPSWGRRRAVKSCSGGGPTDHEEEDYRVDAMEEENSSGRSSGTLPPLPHHQMGGQVEVEIDYSTMAYDMDEEDEEEELINEESGRGGRKRMRKPVKARSLKSLM
ncbi:hypothetical protein SAY87_011594 [Trapa incisa]|uniref:WRC domain-containing protein n=1 Tax=Trapa incisa TaxID=236973 RepID=A0AAN7JIV8_9MYRT|nr:hypothetical protein SAY87_011594 [Trapa incisa]